MEEPSFYPYLSGRNNLRYFQGIGGNRSSQELDRLLEMVGLSERANSKFNTYSMGMKQRLGIAYALLEILKCCSWTSPPMDWTRQAWLRCGP